MTHLMNIIFLPLLFRMSGIYYYPSFQPPARYSVASRGTLGPGNISKAITVHEWTWHPNLAMHCRTIPGRFETSNNTLSHKLGSDWVSGASKQANQRASRLVLTSRLLAVLNHSGLIMREIHILILPWIHFRQRAEDLLTDFFPLFLSIWYQSNKSHISVYLVVISDNDAFLNRRWEVHW